MRLLRRLVTLALALFMLAGCATRVMAPNAPPATAPVALSAWARVLDRFVNARGEVDFASLAQDRADLDRYVRFVADTPVAQVANGDGKLAHLINAYNALSMFNVIESGIPATHAGLNKVTFFFNRKLQIGGEERSLYSFENDLIRPFTRRIGEPRVHFALNCSALACPALPRTPFTATALQEQLARETTACASRPTTGPWPTAGVERLQRPGTTAADSARYPASPTHAAYHRTAPATEPRQGRAATGRRGPPGRHRRRAEELQRLQRAIQAELQGIAQIKSTLGIAHRLSTVVDAHEILVMDSGCIVEPGAHPQLLAANGRQAQMGALQQSAE